MTTVETPATNRDQSLAAMTAARDLSQKLRRTAIENKRLSASVSVLTFERDDFRRQAKDAQNSAAEMRAQRDAANADRDEARRQSQAAAEAAHRAGRQIADLEAALVEANEARRMRDTDYLHERISAAALVIEPPQTAWKCLHCRARFSFDDAGHRCGPLTPIYVIEQRRPEVKP